MGANGLALWDSCFKGESVRTEKQKPRSRNLLTLVRCFRGRRDSDGKENKKQ